MFFSDAHGQDVQWSGIHDFLANQRDFILNYLQFGFEAALLAEMARTGLLRAQVLRSGVDFTTHSVAPKPPTEFTP